MVAVEPQEPEWYGFAEESVVNSDSFLSPVGIIKLMLGSSVDPLAVPNRTFCDEDRKPTMEPVLIPIGMGDEDSIQLELATCDDQAIKNLLDEERLTQSELDDPRDLEELPDDE